MADKGCKYCDKAGTPEEDTVCLLSGLDMDVNITCSEGHYWLTSEYWGEFGDHGMDYVGINYCPMCGRKLEVNSND